MEDLFQALIQGGQQPSKPEAAGPEDDPLAQLLQGFLGGQAAQGDAAQVEPDPTQRGIDLGGLLQGILGGTGGQAASTGQIPEEHGAQAEPGPALGGLLQGILGGMGGQAAGTGQIPEEHGAQAEPGPALGGLLQGILGGLIGGTGQSAGVSQTATSGAGGFSNILGAIMGGGSPILESDAFLAPIVTGLAEKLGLPPQVAQTVVAFVLGKLMGHRLQPGMETGPALTKSGAARPQAAGLEDVVQRMNSGQRVTKTAIRDAGLAEELAAHTGLNRATAEASLQEVLNALGGHFGVGK